MRHGDRLGDRLLVHPPEIEILVDVSEPLAMEIEERRDIEVFVKGGGERKPMVAIEAGPRQSRATHQIQAPREGSPAQAVQVVQVEAFVIGPLPDRLSRPVLDARPAEGHDVERLLHGAPMRLFQAFGSQPVVAVDEGQEPPPRPPQHLVSGRPQALVLLMDDAQTAIAGGQPVEYLPRAVGRAVVDGDDLEIAEGLREQRPHALLDPTLHIVAGEADGDGNLVSQRGSAHTRPHSHMALHHHETERPVHAFASS